ncbi:hypothetical protein TWF102_006668 [Orbilia oligospora]|uniref:Uncharacterized protein n=1 Tax=Orbilia oligospora TaxID=2813651 RepID=A0A7C8NCC1_ORBOL|nr:hypothetical protein TWF102_006668 [Orbilia oligospora]
MTSQLMPEFSIDWRIMDRSYFLPPSTFFQHLLLTITRDIKLLDWWYLGSIKKYSKLRLVLEYSNYIPGD